MGNPTIDSNSDLLQLPFNEVPQWPEEESLPGFRENFENYYFQMTNLAKTLLQGFAIAVGKDESFFQEKLSIDDCMSTYRLNHYPFLDNIDAIEVAPDGTKIGKHLIHFLSEILLFHYECFDSI